MKRLFLKRWGNKQPIQLSILFVGDAEIQKLNKKYRQKNGPTDVLSFPLYEAPKREVGSVGRYFPEGASATLPAREGNISPHTLTMMLGDIVISVETAKRYARRDKMSYEDKTKFLLIHGFLHLLGYDHEISRKEELRMQKKEREYLKLIRRGEK